MLRYNYNRLPIENQRPRCNKMATRMGYVGTPEAFTPGSEDWSLCAQCFQHFLLANRITEKSQKLRLLLALVGNLTFRLLTNLVAPRQPGELTFKEALTELESHSNPSRLNRRAFPILQAKPADGGDCVRVCGGTMKTGDYV